jgi:serpin B
MANHPFGMASAFSVERADFSAMLASPVGESGSPDRAGRGPRLVVSEVRQKTFVDVTEEGTEAAAATMVGVVPTAVALSRDFIVNHPFIAAIRDDRTGALLFVGQIVNP